MTSHFSLKLDDLFCLLTTKTIVCRGTEALKISAEKMDSD